MKLELKHLSPYLPYKLKLRFMHPYVDHQTIGVLNNIYNCDDDVKLSVNYSDDEHIWMYKPILRPLSDFKGMIVRDIKIELELSHNQVMEFFGFMDGEIKLDNITLGLYNAMCKKYIDFNGLIEKKLAIDINTLNN